jgi:hypothetical protein
MNEALTRGKQRASVVEAMNSAAIANLTMSLDKESKLASMYDSSRVWPPMYKARLNQKLNDSRGSASRSWALRSLEQTKADWASQTATFSAGVLVRRTRRVVASFWQNFGKMLLVFGCIGTDFARKYAFCSIFQNLPDYQAEIFEIWQNFANFSTLNFANFC